MMAEPRYALHLHDSELLWARANPAEGTLALRLAAAHVRRLDDGLWGYLPGLELLFHQARWHGDLADALGRIAHGHLRLGEGARLSHWPLPSRFDGGLSAELVLGRGGSLHIQATLLDCPSPAGHFTPSLAC